MYAVVEVSGNQYRVEKDASILVDRLPYAEGETVALTPVLYRAKQVIADPKSLERVRVSAQVVAHERGKKLRVLKFKPKRRYRRRLGHRSELTRLRITDISLARQSKRSQAAGGESDGS
jgi:large subunit ribosomal protein L21